jgi:prepilin-type N-terminal cleavage/methylation domain-containing protein/prepilin-type processing-associated H-X9-DG protein
MVCRRSSVGYAGFTLPELLVVLGIIAVLIGMLLPAVISMRRKALGVACQSNLRTVGQMLRAYENENKGWIYPVQRDAFGVIGLGLNVPPHERWPMLVFKVGAAPLPATYDVAGYDMGKADEPQYDPAPYTPEVLTCPADPAARQAHSYVLNNHLADEGIKAGRTIKGISSSDIVVAGEKRDGARDYYMEYGDYERVVEPFRHGELAGSNYLYHDGHVSTVLPKDAKRGIDPWQVVPQ